MMSKMATSVMSTMATCGLAIIAIFSLIYISSCIMSPFCFFPVWAFVNGNVISIGRVSMNSTSKAWVCQDEQSNSSDDWSSSLGQAGMLSNSPSEVTSQSFGSHQDSCKRKYIEIGDISGWLQATQILIILASCAHCLPFLFYGSWAEKNGEWIYLYTQIIIFTVTFSAFMTFVRFMEEIDRKFNVKSPFGRKAYTIIVYGILQVVSIVLTLAYALGMKGCKNTEKTENLTPPTPVYLHRQRILRPTSASSTQKENTENLPAPPIYLPPCPPPHYEDMIADRGLQNSQHLSLPAVAAPSYESVTSGGHSSSTFLRLDVRLLEIPVPE